MMRDAQRVVLLMSAGACERCALTAVNLAKTMVLNAERGFPLSDEEVAQAVRRVVAESDAVDTE